MATLQLVAVFAGGCPACVAFKERSLATLTEMLVDSPFSIATFQLPTMRSKMPKELAPYAPFIHSFPFFFALPIESWKSGKIDGLSLFNHNIERRPDGTPVPVPIRLPPGTPGAAKPYTADGVIEWLKVYTGVSQEPEEPIKVKRGKGGKGKEEATDKLPPTCRLKIRSRGPTRH